MMRRTFGGLSWPCAAVVALVATASGFVQAMGLPPTPPFARPFAADKKGTVFEEVVRIKEHRNYYFMLVFQTNDIPARAKVEGFLSEAYLDEKRQWKQREPRLLRLQVWELAKTGELLIVERNCRGYEDARVGAFFVEAQFASLKLRPGQYRVRVESLGDIVEISSIPVQINFSIGYNQNATPITH